MKLSHKEWLHIIEVAQLPRSKRNNVSLLLHQYGFTISTNHIYRVPHSHRAFCRLVEKYMENATIELNSCISEIAIQYDTTQKEILDYIEVYPKTGTSLDEFKIESPDMFLRRLAFLCCIHNTKIASKISMNFGITDKYKLFYPMLESVHVLSMNPNLRKKKISLSEVLSYRLGIPSEDILELLNTSIEGVAPSNKHKYLQSYKDKTFLGICHALAKSSHSNFSLVG